jgi:uncharacterized protein (DUF433 family)
LREEVLQTLDSLTREQIHRVLAYARSLRVRK